MRYLLAIALALFCWPVLGQIGPGPSVATPPIISAGKLVIVAPRSLGSAQQSGSGNTTTVITTSAAINAGDVVVVFFADSSNLLTSVSGIGDGSANSYALIKKQNGGSLSNIEMWAAVNAVPLSSGTSITVTHGSTVASDANVAGAVAIAGLLRSSPTDATNGVASTANPSLTTGTLSQANEIVLGASVRPGTSYGGAAGFTSLFDVTVPSGTTLAADYVIVSSTASVTYTPIWSGGLIQTATIVASLKGF